LIDLAKSDDDEEVRRAAVKQLKENDSLTECALHAVDSEVRRYAVLKLKDQQLLLRIAKDDRDRNVRWQALCALNENTLRTIAASHMDIEFRKDAQDRLDDQREYRLEEEELTLKRWTENENIAYGFAVASGYLSSIEYMDSSIDRERTIAVLRSSAIKIGMADSFFDLVQRRVRYRFELNVRDAPLGPNRWPAIWNLTETYLVKSMKATESSGYSRNFELRRLELDLRLSKSELQSQASRWIAESLTDLAALSDLPKDDTNHDVPLAAATRVLVGKLVSDISSTFIEGLTEAVARGNNGDSSGLDAIRKAIKLRSGAPAVQFYEPGLAIRNVAGLTGARDEIIQLAKEQRLLNDVRKTGQLIILFSIVSDREGVYGLMEEIYRTASEREGNAFQLVYNELQIAAKFRT
jgi:hypothetical protein